METVAYFIKEFFSASIEAITSSPLLAIIVIGGIIITVAKKK